MTFPYFATQSSTLATHIRPNPIDISFSFFYPTNEFIIIPRAEIARERREIFGKTWEQLSSEETIFWGHPILFKNSSFGGRRFHVENLKRRLKIDY